MERKVKQLYEAPTLTVVEVRTAGVICQSVPSALLYDPDDYLNGGDPFAF